jgi:hypothetical protein
MNLMIVITSPLTPATTPTNGFVETIAYATSECSLGQVLVARSVKGVCAILIGACHEELEADLAARFPKARLVVNEALVQDDLTKVNTFIDNPAAGLRLPLDVARDAVSAPRVGEASRDSPWKNRHVYRHRLLSRTTHLSPCGRWRLRRQSDRAGCSLSPGGAQQWRSGGLSLGRRAQT